MTDDQILIWIVVAILAWLLWRWLNPKETPEQRAQRLEQEERVRREAAEAAAKRDQAQAEARRVAEAEHARRHAEAETARQEVEQERQRILVAPIHADILLDMRAFLKAGQFFGDEHSPLAYVGYKVGKTNGLPVHDRHRRLRACFQTEIPRQLADKYQAWGAPASHRRYSAMCQHIYKLADMRRQRRNYEVAVAHWDEDETWFKAEYRTLAERLSRVGL